MSMQMYASMIENLAFFHGVECKWLFGVVIKPTSARRIGAPTRVSAAKNREAKEREISGTHEKVEVKH